MAFTRPASMPGLRADHAACIDSTMHIFMRQSVAFAVTLLCLDFPNTPKNQ